MRFQVNAEGWSAWEPYATAKGNLSIASTGEGLKKVSVEYRDRAGNVSAAVSDSTVYDATAPSSPTIAISDNQGYTKNATPDLALSAMNADSMRFQVNAEGWSAWEAYATAKNNLSIASTGEGLKKVYVEYRDRAGNSTAAVSDSTTYDVTAPLSPSIVIAGSQGYTNSATLSLVLSAVNADSMRFQVNTEGWSAWMAYAISKSDLSIASNGDGLKKVYVEYRDRAGNTTSAVYDSVTLDVAAPGTPSIVIADNQGFTKDATPTLTLLAAGADSMRFQLNAEGWSAWESYATSKGNLNISTGGEGFKKIYAEYKDVAGNTSVAVYDSTTFDTTKPSALAVAIVGNHGSTDGSQLTLAIGASGADSMAFKLNSSAWSAYEAYATSKTSFDISSGGEGLKKVYARFRDLAGNQTDGLLYDSTIYDVTAPSSPSIAIANSHGFTKDSTPDLTLFASGADSMRFQVNAEGWSAWTAYAVSKSDLSIASSGDGLKKVYVEYRDRAGNTSAAVYDSVALDVAAPGTPSIVITDNQGFTKSTTPLLMLSSAAADSMRFQVNAEGWSAWEAYATSKGSLNIAGSGEGLKRIYAEFKDIAGNATSAVYDSTTYDTTKPSSLSISITDNQGYTKDAQPDLAISATSADSMAFKLNDGSWSAYLAYATSKTNLDMSAGDEGQKKIYVKFRDLAGNETSGLLYDSTIYDVTAPGSPSIAIVNNQGFTRDSTPDLTLSASGADSMRFQVNAEGWSAWEPYATSKSNFSIASTGDGLKQVAVEYRDLAGNATAAVYDSVILEVAAPGAPAIVIADNNGFTKNATPSLMLSAAGADSMRFRVNAEGWSTWIAYATSNNNLNISSGGEGLKRLSAEYKNIAGNVSAVVFDSTTYDTTAPSSLSIAIADNQGYTKNAQPAISLGASGADSMAFKLNGGIWSAYRPYATSVSDFDISTGGSGFKKVYAKFRDLAGNETDGVLHDSTMYDTAVPTVAIASATTSPTNASLVHLTITFSEGVLGFTASDIITVNGALLNFAMSTQGRIWTADLVPAGEGLVSANIAAGAAQDSAGNGSSASANFTVYYDTSAPVVTVTSRSTRDQTPALSGTVNDSGAFISVTVSGQTKAAVNNRNGTWTLADNMLSTLAEGVYDVAVTATDSAGNAGTDHTTNELHISLAAPVITVNRRVTKDQTPALSGTVSEPTATISISVAGQTKSAANNGNGTWTLADDQLSTIAEGVYDVSASATDTLGNSGSDATTNELVIDITAPVVTVNPLLTKDQTPSLSGTVNDTGAAISVSVGGQTKAATNNRNGTWTLAGDQLTTLSEGTFNVAATATDLAGNSGTDATTGELVIDTTAPSSPFIAIADNQGFTKLVTPALTLSASGADSMRFQVNSEGWSGWEAYATSKSNLTISGTGDGLKKVSAQFKDVAGNEGGIAFDSTTLDRAAPAPVSLTITDNSGFTNIATPVIALSATGADSMALRLNNGAWSAYRVYATNVSDFDITAGGSGLKKVYAKFRDLAGNETSGALYDSTVYDAAGPSSPSIVIADNQGYTKLAALSLTLSAIAADSMRFEVNSEGWSGWEPYATSRNNLSISGSGEGLKRVSVEFKNLAGNVSPPALDSTIYDITAPSVAITSGSTSPTKASPIHLTITFSERVLGFTLSNIAVVNGTLSNFTMTTADRIWTVDLTPVAEGLVSAGIGAAAAQDSAGNGNMASVLLLVDYDATAPVVTVTPRSTRDQTPALSGTVNDSSAAINVTVAGQTNTAVNNHNGTWILADNLLSPLAEGIYDVAVTATDSAGNSGTDHTTNELRISLTSPDVSVISLVTRDQTPALSGTVSEPTAAIIVTVAGQTKPAVNNGNGTWTLADNQLSPIAEGVYDISVTATDTLGNGGSDATTNELTIDLTAPLVTVNALLTKDQTPALSGTIGENGATISVSVAGQTKPAVNNGNGTWTLADDMLSSIAEGTYDIVVTATDPAGNVGHDATTSELTIDITAPGSPSIAIATNHGFTRSAIPALTLFATAADSMRFQVNAEGWSSWEAYAASKSNLTISGTGDGLKKVYAEYKDVAGNVSTAVSDSTVFDLSAPSSLSIVIVDNSGFTNAAHPVMTVSASGADSMALRLNAGSWSAYRAYATSVSDFDIAAGGSGLKKVYVKFRDLAGNETDGSLFDSTVYDSTPPTVAITSATTSPTNAPLIHLTMTFSERVLGFTAGDIATVNGALSNFAVSAQDRIWTADLTPVADGLVGASVRASAAQDSAGNGNTASSLFRVYYDATAPVVTVTPRNTRDQTPALSGTVNDTGATISVTVGGQTKTAANGHNGTWTLAQNALSTLPEGTYDVAVTATDSVGNSGTDHTTNELHISLVAPDVAVNNLVTRDQTPALSGTVSEPTATISISVAGQTKSAVNNHNGTWTLADNQLSTIAEGVYDVTVTATDTLGNSGMDGTANELTIDITAPLVALNSLITRDPTPPLSGSINDNAATINITVAGQNVAAVNNGNGTWTLADNQLAAIAEGTYDVTVTATDSAGNVGHDATTNELTIDTTAPLSPSIAIAANHGFTMNAAPVLTLSATGADSMRLQVNAEGWSPWLAYATSKSNLSISGTGEGLKKVYTEYKDMAGNVSAAVLDSAVYDITAPMSLSIVIADNNGISNAAHPAITLSASGADSMAFRLNGGSWSGYRAYVPSVSDVDISAGGDGQKKVYAKFRDLAGNETNGALYDSTVYDATAPNSPSITIVDNQGFTKSATPELTLSAVGADSVRFQVNAEGWSVWNAYAISKGSPNISGTGEGLKRVYAEYKDIAGNVSAAVYDSTIYDTTAPTSASIIVADNHDYTDNISPTLTLSAVGADSMRFQVNGAAWNAWEPYAAVKSNEDISTGGDGLKKVYVQYKDAAGNSGSTVYDSTNLDRVAPVPVSIAIADINDLTSNAHPAMAISASGADSMAFKLNGGAWSSYVAYAASYSALDISSGGDGLKKVDVKFRDLAGNETNGALFDSTVYDATAPLSASIAISDNQGFTKIATPALTLSATGADSMRFQVNAEGWSAWEAYAASKSNLTISGTGDGLKKVYAEYKDVAGNVSTVVFDSTLYDITAPSASSIAIADNSGFTNAAHPAMTVSASGADSMALRLNAGSWSAYRAYATSVSDFDIAAGGDGLKKVYVKFRDLAGNETDGSLFDSTVYDSTPPTVAITSATTSPTNAPLIHLTMTFSERVLGFTAGDIATVNGALSNFAVSTPDRIWTADLTPVADGLVSASVGASAASDSAGNGNTASSLFRVYYDATAPVVTVTPRNTRDQTPALSGTVNDTGATISVTVGGQTKTAANGHNGTWTLAQNALSTLPEGTYDVAVTATDSVGNSGTDHTTNELHISLVAPDVAVNNLVTRDQTPALSGTVSEPTATISISVAGQTKSAVNNHNGTWTLADNQLSTIAEGVYDVTVTATDTLGNSGTDATTNELTIDITAPTSPLITITDNFGYTRDSLPGLTLSAVKADSMRFQVNAEGWSAWEVFGTAKSNFAISKTGEGLKRLYVEYRDKAGNISAAVYDSTTYDVSAPASASIALTDNQGFTKLASPVLTLSASGADSMRFEVNAEGWSPWESYATSKSNLSISGTGAGLKKVYAAYKDLAGNVSAAVYDSTIYDLTAPASLSITIADNNGFTNAAQPAMTIGASGADSMTFKLNGGAWSAYRVFATTVSDFDLSTGGNGLKKVYAKFRDLAGNETDGLLYDSTVYDVAAPSVAITSTSASPTNASTIPITITFSERVTGFTSSGVAIVNGSLSNLTMSTPDRIWTADLAPTAEGLVSAGVGAALASDSAGNGNTASALFKIYYDRTAPVVTVTSRSTRDQTPALSGTVNDTGATISVTVGGQTKVATNNRNGSWTLADNILSVLAEGTYDVAVTATDAAGNIGADHTTDELHISLAAPEVSVNSRVTNDQTPSLGGTVSDPAATISVSVAGQTKAAVNNGNGTWTLADNQLSAIAEGTYDVSVTATSVLGNSGSDATTNELTIDITAPQVTVTSLLTNDQTPALSGTVNDSSATINVAVGGQTRAAANNGNGTWTLADNQLSALAEGTYNVAVTATDLAGNTGADGTAGELIIDTTAPAAPAIVIADNYGYTNSVTPHMTLSALGVDSMRFQVNGAAWSAWETYAAGKSNLDISASGDGQKKVYVQYKDLAGNTGSAVYDSTTLDRAPPVPVSIAITDNSGSTGSATPVLVVSATGADSMALRLNSGAWSAYRVYATGVADFDVSAGGNGLKKIYVKFRDLAGNETNGALFDSTMYTSTGPSAPVIVISDNYGFTKLATPALTLSAIAADSMRFQVNAEGWSAWEAYAASKGNLSVSGAGEGLKKISVEYRDLAGNITPAVYDSTVFDTTAPRLISLSIEDKNGFTRDSQPDIVISATGADSMAFRLNNGVWSAYEPYATSKTNLTISGGGDGLKRVFIRLRDLAGNATDASLYDSTVYDATAPIVTVASRSTRDNTPSLSGTVNDSSAILHVTVAGQTMAAVNNRNGTWSLADNLLAALAVGTYDVAVIATDGAGNTGVDTTVNELTIEPTPPSDTTPPSFNAGYPKLVYTLTTSAGIAVRMSEPSTVYLLALDSGAAAPSSANIKQGKDSLGTVVAARYRDTAVIGSSADTLLLDSLGKHTAYSVFLTAVDTLGNLLVPPVRLRLTTAPGDTVPPRIASITSSVVSGLKKIGDTVPIVLHFTEPVTLTGGQMNLVLETGDTDRTAIFLPSGSVDSAVALYIVKNGDSTSHLTARSVSVSGAELRDTAGNSALLILPLGHNLGDNAALAIDGIKPAISIDAPQQRDTIAAAHITYRLSEQIASGIVIVRHSGGAADPMLPMHVSLRPQR